MAGVTWDVVVIGSGPGGAAAAIGALAQRPTASVLMLDRSAFPRDKCCGDGVLLQALQLLGEHGVDAPALVRGYRVSRTLDIQSVDGAITATRDLPSRSRSCPAPCSTTDCAWRRAQPARSGGGTRCAGSATWALMWRSMTASPHALS